MIQEHRQGVTLRLGVLALGLALGGAAPGTSQVLPDVPASVSAHLAGALQFATISHDEEETPDPAPFDGLRTYLRETFPKGS